MKLTRTRIAITIALLAAPALVGVTSASAASAADRYINVSATGTVKVTPDTVRFDLTVSNVSPTSAAALSAANKEASAVRDSAKANGIITQYITSQSITTYPEYNYSSTGGSTLIGYRASQQFEIIIRNAKNAGAVVDAVSAAVPNDLTINGVTPYVFDDSASTMAARTVAVKNAKAKASSYAKLLGVNLGSVTYLEESGGGSPVSPYPVMMAAAKADSGATTVDLGQQDVSISVNVRWSIK